MSHKKIVVLYHADCPDGFGGAYAAWKKFEDDAEYIPVEHGLPPPDHLAGKEVYIIDFSYPAPVLNKILTEAKSLVVLDHHKGTREVVESIPQHVYDEKHSGAFIAWNYFHPGTPVPVFLLYVQEGDLYTFLIPNAQAVLAYCYTLPFTFEKWDSLVTSMEDPAEVQKIAEHGEIYVEYGNALKKQIADRAWLVSFEGHEVLAVDAPRAFGSDIGHMLAQRKPPFAMVIRAKKDGIRVSLRGNGSIDVSELARKYGGNGHPNAAAFSIPHETPLPFHAVEHHENPGD
jgi:hypothetical protein